MSSYMPPRPGISQYFMSQMQNIKPRDVARPDMSDRFISQYEQALQSQPKYENPSWKRKLLTGMIGGAVNLASHSQLANQPGNSMLGIEHANELLDAPYNRSVQQWNMRTRGLGDLADIETKRNNILREQYHDELYTARNVYEQQVNMAKAMADFHRDDETAAFNVDKERFDRYQFAENEDFRERQLKETKRLHDILGQADTEERRTPIDEKEALKLATVDVLAQTPLYDKFFKTDPESGVKDRLSAAEAMDVDFSDVDKPEAPNVFQRVMGATAEDSPYANMTPQDKLTAYQNMVRKIEAGAKKRMESTYTVKKKRMRGLNPNPPVLQ